MTRRSSGAQALPRSELLRSTADFQAVFQRGKREERRSFVALWRPAPGGRRAGFTASRQLRGAVRRNRARRRLREAYRRERAAVPSGIEIVFVARPALLALGFTELREEMKQVGKALGGIGRAARAEPS